MPNAARFTPRDIPDDILRRKLNALYDAALPTASTAITASDSPYTVEDKDVFLPLDCANGPITINLPAVKGKRTLHFKKVDSTGNAITLDPDGTEKIDGELTATINVQWTTVTIMSNGTEWYVV